MVPTFRFRRARVQTLVVAVLLVPSFPASGTVTPTQRVAPACAPSDDPRASSVLNCLTLVAVPDLPSANGIIHVRPVPTPFGVSVRPDGRPRYQLIATLKGLPDPRSLGNYTTYIAWGYTVSLDSAVKLGPVTNGVVSLGELNFVQFRILVTAERSTAVTQRGRRLVLRGTSPSARLMAHRDLMQPSAPGAMRDPTPAAGSTPLSSNAMAMSHGSPNAGHGTWVMPPMPAGAMNGMMGMDGMHPSVSPFRPGAGVDPVSLPLSRPRELVRLADGDTLNLESGLVRRAIGGRTFVMYGFNRQHPGPLIDVAKGATIVVRFRNGIDQPSAIHWHGVRLDNRFDGAVGVTQDAVPAGGTFTYVVRFPDAGIYWYHPHVREDIQQDLGLYGNMLVRPTQPGYYAPVHGEQVLMLDDLLAGDDGPTPHGAESPTHALMGRFGNILLVNGEPRYDLTAKRGEIVRFYLTNVSNTRLYNISLPGARMKVVAGDVGKFEREEWTGSIVLAPAERYIVDVEFARAGVVPLLNRVQALDHMRGTYSSVVDTLGLVRVGAASATPSYAASFARLRRNADVEAELAPLRRLFDAPPAHSLVLSMRTRGLPAILASMLVGINAAVEWNDGMSMMNWITTGKEVSWILRDPATGKENMDIDWRFRRGDIVKLRIVNDPSSDHAMEHPLHLHGQRFLVVKRDGVASTNLAWKDTAIIPAGETVDLLVDMANPGRWMVHCHVAEHLGTGMMAVFEVGR
ncbi:MAG TPA: multicopper oxidase family protein [Gemmatimonas sp.]|nr:multicopper oxidase family protein [Gemmatimonas sp.]